MRTPQPTVANDGLTAAARGRAISAIAILVFSLSLASVGQAQRRIAYASDRGGNTDVRIMKASGAGDRRMTTHPAEDRDPTWAPNGRQIAFASDRDGVPQIYVIDLDGTGLRRLTDIPRGAHEPDWHPSGSRLLYSEWDGGIVGDIFTVDAESGRVQNISRTATQWEGGPAWAPDGEFIATTWSEFPDSPVLWPPGIAIMRDTGAHAADFVRRGKVMGSPSWAPDARRLTLHYMSAVGGDAAVYILDIDEDEFRRLTGPFKTDLWPEWSPDGEEIAFTSRRHGKSEIYTVFPASKVERRLTHNPGRDYEPAWSPRGLAVNASVRMLPTVWGWLRNPSAARDGGQ